MPFCLDGEPAEVLSNRAAPERARSSLAVAVKKWGLPQALTE